MGQESSPKKPRGGCLRILAGLLLALPCLNALVLLVHLLAAGSSEPGLTADKRLVLKLSLAATVLVFGGGGIALIVSGARANSRRLTLQAQIVASNPDDPWLWIPEWASGRIAGDGPPIALTVIAVLWNTFAWKMAPLSHFIRVRDIVGGFVSLVLLAVGLHIARVTVREAARYLRFRPVSFRLETIPGVIGGRVRGWIESGGALPAGAEAVVGISCTRVTKIGRSTRQEVVWQEERTAHSLTSFAGSMSIPVDFAIPSGLPESSRERGSPSYIWKLRAHARIAGPDFEAEFEIPVFNTGAHRESPVAGTAARVEGS